MRVYKTIEIEIVIDGQYTPEDEGVSSQNVLPENCYPGSSSEFDINQVYFQIDGKLIKVPDYIYDILDYDEILEDAYETYTN